MRELYPVLLVISLFDTASCLNYQPPICSLEGLRIGAGLGSVAGAVGGVAATSGATTLATCPALMVSTLGHGLVRNQFSRMIFLIFYFSQLGPGGPLIALIAGALLGGVAGGTAGGVYTCAVEGDHYVIRYVPDYHVPPSPHISPLTVGYNHHVHPSALHSYHHYAQQPSYSYYPYRWKKTRPIIFDSFIFLVEGLEKLEGWTPESLCWI